MLRQQVVLTPQEAEKIREGIGSLLWVMNNRHNWADPRWDGFAEAAENDARDALAVLREKSSS